MAKIMYLCENMPQLELRVKDGDPKENTRDVTVKFVNKVLSLDEEEDAERIALLDALIVSRENVRLLVRKANMEHAINLVRQHQAQTLPGQVKGPMTAAHVNAVKIKQQSEHLAVQMRAEGATEEQITSAIEALAADSNLILAVKTEEPVTSPMDGITKTPEVDTARQITALTETQVVGNRPNLPKPPGNKPQLNLPKK